MADRQAWKGERATPVTPGATAAPVAKGADRRKQVFILAAAFAAPAPVAAASDEIPKGVEWVNDWDRALIAAAERGVPLLISFANDD